jgi:uncharacterized membrane protein YgdD (TMEM256/DUF423 family)
MNIFDKKIAFISSILAAITIAIGAFGAHGLKEVVSADSLTTFEVGVRYQMYHSISLLLISFATVISSKARKMVFLFFIFGIIFFCGSIYLLALKEVLPFSVSFLGPITPIGGILFIIGWLRLAYGLLTNK